MKPKPLSPTDEMNLLYSRELIVPRTEEAYDARVWRPNRNFRLSTTTCLSGRRAIKSRGTEVNMKRKFRILLFVSALLVRTQGVNLFAAFAFGLA